MCLCLLALLAVTTLRPGAAAPLPVLHSLGAVVLAGACGIAALAFRPVVALEAPLVDASWPSLQSMATLSLVLTLAQAAMGAAVRHQMMGLMGHVVGALLVALLVLITAISVLTQAGASHPRLARAAIGLIVAASVQVILGIGAYLGRAGFADGGNVAAELASFAPSAHAATGALTLAFAGWLVVEVRRGVIRPNGNDAGHRIEPMQVAR
jgi:hypothetical protein